MPTPWIGYSLKIDVEFVHIDVEKLEAAVDEALQSGWDKLRDEIDKKWRAAAKSTLDESEAAYLKGLTVSGSGMEIDVRLTGDFPVALEQGSSRFDLKPGFLKNLDHRIIPIGKKGAKPKFRIVRSTSPGWWHPGIQAKSIHKQIFSQMPRIVNDILTPLLSRIKV